MALGEGKSFWGDPTHKTQDKDVARFVEVIRTITNSYGDKRALKIATSACTPSLHSWSRKQARVKRSPSLESFVWKSKVAAHGGDRD